LVLHYTQHTLYLREYFFVPGDRDRVRTVPAAGAGIAAAGTTVMPVRTIGAEGSDIL
jgi:hypothetical protein